MPHRIFHLVLFFLVLVAGTKLHAQKKYRASDSVAVTEMVEQIDELIKKASYDSAIKRSEQLLDFSKRTGFKRGEAYAWDKLSDVMMPNGKMTEVKRYDSLLLPLALQLKDSILLANSYNRMGVYFMETGKGKDAAKNFNQALDLKLEKEQSQKTAEVYSNIASLHLANGEKDKASELFFKALRLFEKNKSERGMGETYSNISSVFFLMDRRDEAINYLNKSIALREKQNDVQGLVIAYSNIAQMYVLKDSVTKGLGYQAKAITNAEKINNPKLMATGYAGMASIYSRTKMYPQALDWQAKAIKLFEAVDNKPMLSRLYAAAGNLSNNTNDSAGALSYYQKALKLGLELGNKDNISIAYERLSNFYQQHNDPSRAYQHYRSYISYRDSIASRSTLSSIEEIKTRYETEKKDGEIQKLNAEKMIQQLELEKQQALISGNMLAAKQKQNEIDLLSKENELRDARLKQQGEELEKQMLVTQNKEQQLKLSEQEKLLQQKQLEGQKSFRNIMFAAIATALVIALALFNRYQLKRKLAQQHELLQVRNHISRNLHDDIGASLSNISILNELAKRNAGDKDKTNSYLGKAGEDIQRISESLSDIVWNINPKYDELENLFVRMKRYGADMLEGKDIEGLFIFPEDDLAVKLTMLQRRDLYLIYKEAINNMAKYSGAGKALVKIQINKKELEMLIEDDGKGFDRRQIVGGNGLTNMEQRAVSSKASLDIVSATGKGTRIRFLMPLS